MTTQKMTIAFGDYWDDGHGRWRPYIIQVEDNSDKSPTALFYDALNAANKELGFDIEKCFFSEDCCVTENGVKALRATNYPFSDWDGEPYDIDNHPTLDYDNYAFYDDEFIAMFLHVLTAYSTSHFSLVGQLTMDYESHIGYWYYE